MKEKKTSFEESEIKEILEEKPELKIVGNDGNAFFILGTAQRSAKKAGWDKEKIDKFMDEAQSGNYDHLLSTCMEYFNVC